MSVQVVMHDYTFDAGLWHVQPLAWSHGVDVPLQINLSD